MAGYEDAVSNILSNLSEYSSFHSFISVYEVLEDDQLDVAEEAFDGDMVLDPQIKYLSADGAVVYVFGSPTGLELVGNKAMIDMNLPEEFPSIYYSSWAPLKNLL